VESANTILLYSRGRFLMGFFRALTFLLCSAFLISLSGCTQSTANAAPLSPNYLEAQKALTVDDFANAKKALKALAAESSGDFGKAADEAASAPDIDSMRMAFRQASDVLIRNGVPAEYAVAYCPMYKGGASWVQAKGSIENPYTGRSMPGCGEFRKK
jgi:acyl-CoA synthetase (AMP-forming)/AMP-acid ligase II